MIYRLVILFSICSLFSCSDEGVETDLIEENYTYYDSYKADSIKCLQVGIQFVDEKGTIPFSAIKHELVDETPAKVKLVGKIIRWEKDSLLIHFKEDTIWAKTSFLINKPQPFIGLNSFIQGEIQMHPQISLSIDGLLLKGISK